MERLTQFNESYYEIKDDKGNFIAPKYSKLDQVITKLGKLEDIEEELGCPLDVYVKLHKIVYVYTKVGKCKLLKVQDGFIVVKIDNKTTYLPLKEYTETWWLKEDRSE